MDHIAEDQSTQNHITFKEIFFKITFIFILLFS